MLMTVIGSVNTNTVECVRKAVKDRLLKLCWLPAALNNCPTEITGEILSL